MPVDCCGAWKSVIVCGSGGVITQARRFWRGGKSKPDTLVHVKPGHYRGLSATNIHEYLYR